MPGSLRGSAHMARWHIVSMSANMVHAWGRHTVFCGVRRNGYVDEAQEPFRLKRASDLAQGQSGNTSPQVDPWRIRASR